MADFLSKIRIPKATEHRTDLNLSCDHVTTSDWFKIKPVYNRVLVPGQSINIDMSNMVRLMPLQKPFFGSAQIVNRAFFVPFRTIMEGFNEFITDAVYTNSSFTGLISSVPTVNNENIWYLIRNNSVEVEAATSTNWDFNIDSIHYKLTLKGKRIADILRCLGYQIHPFKEGQPVITYSALPLLAYFKIYQDWFKQNTFADNYTIDRLFLGVGNSIGFAVLSSAFEEVLVANYAPDYFTSAWSYPSGPSSNLGSNFVLEDISMPSTPSGDTTTSRVSSFGNYLQFSSPYIEKSSISRSNMIISQYIIDSLQSLSDYLKRHQLVGSKALDRFRARFGITLPDAKLNRSVYLGKNVSPISISDVTSTSDTEGAVLGQFAGFGYARDKNMKFSFRSDEYGIFIITSIIVPVHTSYFQGIDRHLLDVNKLDFYTPEFDGLGCQAIANSEVIADYDSTAKVNNNLNGVWAYTARYGHMKVGHDWLTGDFRNNASNQNLDSFHLFRKFSDLPGKFPIFNKSFLLGQTSEYDRVFNDTDNYYDHFICGYHFDVHSSAPMSPLFENYHFDEAGEEVTQKIGGTKLT